MLIDKSIPFWKFGCSSLVEFLRTVPGIRMSMKGPECYVEAMPTSESAHISNLIARQKTGSKKPKKLVNCYRFYATILLVVGITSSRYAADERSKINAVSPSYDDQIV